MPHQSPLEIQELLDRCINLVAGSGSELYIHLYAPDLLACSLVARSWVHTAQSQLFRAPTHTNPSLAFESSAMKKFCAVLRASPHLLQHVRLLRIDYNALPPHCLKLLCRQSFTRLESLIIRVDTDSRTSPTPDTFPRPSTLLALRHLALDVRGSFSLLDSIVQQFPLTIEHLDLDCFAWDSDSLSDIASTMPLIELKSARLNMWHDRNFTWFPPHLGSSYPFDFSQLKALAILYAGSIDWSAIPTSRIEILDLHVRYEDTNAVDLTAFPMLRILRFGMDQTHIPRIVAETLSTVTSQHRIRTIIISVRSSMNRVEYEELDSIISSIQTPTLPAVELEHMFDDPPNFARDFPKLIAKNSFRVVSYNFVGDRWQMLVNQL